MRNVDPRSLIGTANKGYWLTVSQNTVENQDMVCLLQYEKDNERQQLYRVAYGHDVRDYDNVQMAVAQYGACVEHQLTCEGLCNEPLE